MSMPARFFETVPFVAIPPCLYCWDRGSLPLPLLIFGTALLGAALVAAAKN